MKFKVDKTIVASVALHVLVIGWGLITFSTRALEVQPEALFATAIGLIAAIPATIFYNKFTSEVNRQAQRLEGFADEFSAILSRQIDERA